jgi:hypothetical protein
VRRVALAAALAAPALLRGQDVVVREPGSGRGAAIVRDVVARPHTVLSGSGPLQLPRDSTVTTSLVVLGRPTYVASRVQGDVVVVGGDLFLRPGVEITGRAIAIGGTVATTTLGRVVGGTESLRDESFAIERNGDRYALDYRDQRAGPDAPPMFQPAGIYGFVLPKYDRVDGLSLPVAALVTLGQGALEVQPSVTYRSRLGVVDPGLAVRVLPARPVYLEARAARDTRTNDAWIYSDLVNSAVAFLIGRDARNYFRSDVGEARLAGRIERETFTLEPYLGGRLERVWPITAVGNVFAFRGRHSEEKMARPNPLVEPGHIGSAIVGSDVTYAAGPVTGRLSAQLEQGFQTPPGTSGFTQVTLNGRVEFPTFATQRLVFRGHAVGTLGDSVPMARYAYLGGAGTLPVLEMLEQGGSQLVFLESRYLIPIERIQLPMIGAPVLTLRHMMGAAGPQSLPRLEQEIGAGLGFSALRFDVTTDAAGRRGTTYGVGISLGH